MGKGSGSEPVTYRKTSSASTTSDPCTQDLWTGSHTADPDVDGGVRVASLTVPSHWSPVRIAPSDWSAPDDHDRTTVQSLFLRVGHTIIADFDFSLAHNTCSTTPPPPPTTAINTPSRAPSRTRPVLSHVYGLMGTPPCSLCAHCYEARKQSNWGVITPDFGAITAARLS